MSKREDKMKKKFNKLHKSCVRKRSDYQLPKNKAYKKSVPHRNMYKSRFGTAELKRKSYLKRKEQSTNKLMNPKKYFSWRTRELKKFLLKKLARPCNMKSFLNWLNN